MRLKEMTVATLAGWLLITPTMASENWKADAEKWQAEAKKWEAEREHKWMRGVGADFFQNG